MKQVLLIICLSLMLPLAACAEEQNQEQLHTLDIGKIVITPSRVDERYEDLPQNVSVVSSDAIEDAGVTDIAAALDRLPSVNIIDYGADGAVKTVHSRGFSGAQVLTLLDGIPTHTPRDGLADLNKINLLDIEQIEVLRGPASNIYGSGAMGGVLNIITKDGKSFDKTAVRALYGLNDTRQVTLAHGKDLDTFDYYFSHDSFKTDAHRQNSDHEYHNTKLKLGYEPQEDNRLMLAYRYYQSQTGALGLNAWPDVDNRQETWQQNMDFTWDADLTETGTLLFKFFHNIDRLEFIWNEAGDNVDAHHSTTYGGDLQWAQKIFDSLRVTAGYNRKEFGLNSSSTAKHGSFLNAFYGEFEYDPFEKLKLYFGTRYDDYSNFGDRFSPNARFAWWVNDNFKVHGLYARSFRAPTFNDLYWPREAFFWGGGSEGNDQLTPEEAKSFEVGFSTYFLKALWTDITYFRNEVDDLIIWNMDQNFWWRPENVSSATIQGAEFNSDFVIWKKIRANVNYTYLHAKNKDTEDWLIYRPQHTYKLNLNYKTDNDWTFDLSGRYITKRYTVDNNIRNLGHYWVADASISKKFKEIWEFQVTALNLFDEEYEEQEGYPMPPLHVLWNLKCEF